MRNTCVLLVVFSLLSAGSVLVAEESPTPTPLTVKAPTVAPPWQSPVGSSTLCSLSGSLSLDHLLPPAPSLQGGDCINLTLVCNNGNVIGACCWEGAAELDAVNCRITCEFGRCPVQSCHNP
jgi:hypothetical protein